ncbi:TolC family protein [Halarcobacter ebronensis]|uniref:TolC family protein n=1 Tax=Halarcobacter ebronensis TaxID=1462615 RepID=UPI0013E973BC|nr:TolC family protein [Halarcobacter ebronensis]QKF83171.1 outer membrane efflux protein, TolC family [Halarcobacter ebronensis]
MKKIVCVFLLACIMVNAKEFDLTLDKAIDLALENNGLNKISKLNLEIAKAQYEQALSANYPSLDVVLYAKRDDKDTIYQQRGEFKLPADMAAALGMMGITSTSISADIDTIAVGRDTVRGELEVNYPLYTGGKISSIIQQAKLNKEIKAEAIKRSESSVVYDVKRYFYGYIFVDSLYKLINDIYENMKFSRDLTKEFLENGTTLNIKKTDYLNIKLITSLIETTLYKIDTNRKILEGAIGNLIGLKYNDVIKITYEKQEILKQNQDLETLVKKSMDFNSDIRTIDLALKIKDEQIKEAKSEYQPMVNLFGNINHTYNSYQYGYLYEENANRWTVGLAVKMSLFNGFKTDNQVLEKRLDKKIVNEQKILLEDGLALQLKNEFIKSSLGFKQLKALQEAVDAATENSITNFKAYKYEMVEAKDLVQSSMMEVYVKADYLKSLHDYLISLATIDKLIGKKLEETY